MRISPAALSAAARGDLANFLTASTPGGIERQEAEGQASMVRASDHLPAKINFPHGLDARSVYPRLGIEVGEMVDDIFIAAKLPEGWSINPTTHSMWSELLDAQGRKRAGIFYKAAFYDRSAHLNLECRYVVRNDYASPTATVSVLDSATGRAVHNAGSCPLSDFYECDKVDAQARKWLSTNYPQHDDPFAYWDDAAAATGV